MAILQEIRESGEWYDLMFDVGPEWDLGLDADPYRNVAGDEWDTGDESFA